MQWSGNPYRYSFQPCHPCKLYQFLNLHLYPRQNPGLHPASCPILIIMNLRKNIYREMGIKDCFRK